VEASEWLEITTVCERFHVLPNPGGVLQQDPNHVRKLLVTLDRMEEWRKEEMEKDKT
jgi:hypothetical protein